MRVRFPKGDIVEIRDLKVFKLQLMKTLLKIAPTNQTVGEFLEGFEGVWNDFTNSCDYYFGRGDDIFPWVLNKEILLVDIN